MRLKRETYLKKLTTKILGYPAISESDMKIRDAVEVGYLGALSRAVNELKKLKMSTTPMLDMKNDIENKIKNL